MNAISRIELGTRSRSVLSHAGIFCLPVADPRDETAARAALATVESDISFSQSRGFGFAWLSEHHNSAYGGCIPDPLTLITALGQRVKGIKLGTAVLLAPLRHPIMIAEQAQLVSRLIDQPVELGLGRGFLPGDQADFGLTSLESSKLFWEAVLAIAAEPTGMVSPSTVWVATTHPERAEDVGRLGFGLALNPYTRSANETDMSIAAYKRAFELAGHAHSARVLIHEPLVIADTAANARETGRRHFSAYLDTLRQAEGRDLSATADPRHRIGAEDYAARCPFEDEAGFRRHVLSWIGRGATHWCFQVRFGGMPDEVTRSTIDRCSAVLYSIGCETSRTEI